MTECTLNSTAQYHRSHLTSLGWELTMCNALRREQTPLRRILRKDDSFGCLLYDFLDHHLLMGEVRKVIEIGGGYGYLMADFLDKNRALEPCMLDISPFLLQRQRESLRGRHVSYREEDFLCVDTAFLGQFDLAVMNENLGDFPTLVDLTGHMLDDRGIDDAHVRRARRLCETYGLERTQEEPFPFNLGAIEAVEKLCLAGIPNIYLGEHSCEAHVPTALRGLMPPLSAGIPERIRLMGHDEYSIQFSFLERVAHTCGYRSARGPFADFIPVEITDRVRSMLASRGRYSDEDELICQFVEDIYKYEYLILSKS